MTRVRLGVSACLLGEPVRWDGGDRRCALLVERLARHAELVGVCPEVSVGMGVPREPVQLVATLGGPRMRGVTSRRDWTDALAAWAAAALRDLEAAGPLAGFVLKARSPSCGLDAPLFDDQGAQVAAGPGLFARVVTALGVPAIDEAGLADPARSDDFLARAFTRARLLAGEALPRGLARALGARDLAGLARPSTPGRWARALAGALRRLRADLSPGELSVARAALAALWAGRVDAAGARACLRRLARARGRAGDLLLEPYPADLEP
ncbi:MAG: DUF523 domain-containing protein [Planctomycetes bacterium]|nr:DUF523 domain-containing protein [Planctomycetota bacterium]